jgi:hypothetical protein
MIHMIVYATAGVALWRLWNVDHRILWWTIIALVVLTFWTAETIKTAFNDAIQRSGADATDPLDSFVSRKEAMRDDVVRFWTIANFIITAATFILALIGIGMSLR